MVASGKRLTKGCFNILTYVKCIIKATFIHIYDM